MIRFASSLRARLIAFVLFAVIPAFAVILFTDQRHRDSIATHVQDNALVSARFIATEQRRIFENAHQLLITLARLPQIREQNSLGCEKILASLLEPLYVDLGVIDTKGNVLCNALGSKSQPNRRMKDSYIRRAVETQDLTVGEIQRDSASGKTVIELGFPVSDSPGNVRGIAFVILDYSWIVRITAENHLPSEASFIVFDEKGTIFLRYPDQADALGTRIQAGVLPNAKVVRGVEGNIKSLGPDRIARLFTYRQLDHRIAGAIMYAGIDIPGRAAFAGAERILRQNLLILGALTLLTLIAAWFGADLFVLRRLRDLMAATKQLAVGNLKARTTLPYGGSELSHLARTFDDLAETLQKRAAEAKIAETEIQKQHLRQSAIHEISAAMTSSLDVGKVLDALLEGVITLFPFSCVTLSWIDENATLDPIGFAGRPHAKGLQSRAEGERGIPKEVFKHKFPLLIANVPTDSRASDPDSLRAAGFITYLGLPLIVKNEQLGVLSFYSTEEIDLKTEEMDFLASLTQQAAVALYNSRLYEQTRNQAVELEKSNRIKDDFLGVISHELRTPLNVIMNCTEALNMGVFGALSPENLKGTARIGVQASHLLSLINGILEITKIETGAIAVNMEPIDLIQLIEELESDYAIASKEKELTIEWKVTTDLPPIVSDRMKLRQVIINIVNNAIKFTDQGSVIVLFRPSPEQAGIEFSVADTGIGIAEESLPYIFDKFHQADGSTTRNFAGAGLGLYLVKHFVGIMGGSLRVESKLGEGTTFTVRIPSSASVGSIEDERLAIKITDHFDASQPSVEGEL
ncbi:MAG: HAMP domain-containing protein [Deltaproteobacteria bacterium]|nr:HAMP domain-containing protein [Deltaproteobacteria bacterium]